MQLLCGTLTELRLQRTLKSRGWELFKCQSWRGCGIRLRYPVQLLCGTLTELRLQRTSQSRGWQVLTYPREIFNLLYLSVCACQHVHSVFSGWSYNSEFLRTDFNMDICVVWEFGPTLDLLRLQRSCWNMCFHDCEIQVRHIVKPHIPTIRLQSRSCHILVTVYLASLWIIKVFTKTLFLGFLWFRILQFTIEILISMAFFKNLYMYMLSPVYMLTLFYSKLLSVKSDPPFVAEDS